MVLIPDICVTDRRLSLSARGLYGYLQAVGKHELDRELLDGAGDESQWRPALKELIAHNLVRRDGDTLVLECRYAITHSVRKVGWKQEKADDCPHREIIDLYHRILPACPRVREWNEARQSLLRRLWREHPDPKWFEGYFSYVAESEFLTGRVKGNGREPFRADLEWIIKPSNFAKIYEGKYHVRKT